MLDQQMELLERLHDLYESNDRFQQIYRDFEQQKICYIPIGGLLLKPLHRLLHYQLILESMFYNYKSNNIHKTILDSNICLCRAVAALR